MGKLIKRTGESWRMLSRAFKKRATRLLRWRRRWRSSMQRPKRWLGWSKAPRSSPARSKKSGEALNDVYGLNDVAAKLNASVSGFRTRDGGLVIFDLAKNDHRAFVHKIGAFVQGSTNLEVSDLPDHHNCRFGKWYDRDGRGLPGPRELFFDEIASPHQRIRRTGKGC